MKAEERKQIETNSIVLLIQRWRKHANWKTAYYIVGTLILIVTAIVLYRYFTGESSKARDAILQQLANANTTEKLKQGIEDHRGTIYGSMFKLHLARHLLKVEGLPKLGTDRADPRSQAVANIEQARTYYVELSSELKPDENAAMLQEVWASLAQAEEALVGLPTTEGGGEYRGNIDKAVEYYEKAAAIFPDKDHSKRYKERADKIKANKDQFVAAQRELYKLVERPVLPPDKVDPFLPPVPSGPKLPTSALPEIPPAPMPPDGRKTEPKLPETPKIELPKTPEPPVDSKKSEPKSTTPSKSDTGKTDPKKSEPPKVNPKKS